MKNSVIRTLKDQYKQRWNSQLENSSKGQNYKLLKTDIAFESYLSNYPKKVYLPLIKFRTSNHKLPVERGRWENKPYNERLCNICQQNTLGQLGTSGFKAVLLIGFSVFACFGVSFCTVFTFCVSGWYLVRLR